MQTRSNSRTAATNVVSFNNGIQANAGSTKAVRKFPEKDMAGSSSGHISGIKRLAVYPLGGIIDQHQVTEDKYMEISRDELDAKLAANQARLEVIELRIESKLDSAIGRLEANQREISLRSEANLREFAARVDSQLSHTAKTGPMLASVFVTGISVLGIFLGVVSYASDRFDGGIGVMSSHMTEIEALKSRQAATEESFSAAQKSAHEQYLDLSRKLDAIAASARRQ